MLTAISGSSVHLSSTDMLPVHFLFLSLLEHSRSMAVPEDRAGGEEGLGAALPAALQGAEPPLRVWGEAPEAGVSMRCV